VYSLNVPVPGRIVALAEDLAAEVAAGGADTWSGAQSEHAWSARDEHTLVLKRLTDPDGGDASRSLPHFDDRVRDALAGTAPFGARVSRADYFAEAASGPSPVLYLAVESPELERLHGRLAETFDTVAGVEGPDYVPHVTVARGGSVAAAERVAGPVSPVEWTVSELVFWDARYGEIAGRLPLPA